MSDSIKNHWDILKHFDEDLSSSVTLWRKQITDYGSIPPKYQELMKLAMASVIRFPSAITTHANAALNLGATREELFHAIALAMMFGGIPAYRESATLLKDILIND